MRKQDLVHLHRLLSKVVRSTYARSSDDCTVDQYESRDLEEAVDGLGINSYADLDVRPTSVHSSKTGHKEAVLVLANALSSLQYEKNRETDLRPDGGEEESGTDLKELGEEILGDYEEVEEQEEDPIENRHVGKREEIEEPEDDDAGYEGYT